MKKSLKFSKPIKKMRKFDEEEYDFPLDRNAEKLFLKDSEKGFGKGATRRMEKQFFNDLIY